MRAKKLNLLLAKRNYTIAAAESCTGGLFTSKIIDVSGSSGVINSSIITYSNEAKIKYAGVNKDTLKEHGAVSEQTVGEMARGIAKECSANVGVAISGIAGPTGGTEEKPVGLMYSTIYTEKTSKTYKIQLNPNLSRLEIKTRFVNEVLKNIYKFLNQKE